MTDSTSSTYDRAHVFARTNGIPFASVSTFCNGSINARIMVFACTDGLDRYYLLTDEKTDKVRELASRPEVTLAILGQADTLDDHCETIVRGKAEIVREYSDDAAQEALQLLSKKAPDIGGLLDAGTLANYVVLKVTPDEIVFRYYRDVIANNPKTIFSA